MRYKEIKQILKEYKDISQAKKEIIQKIVDLDPADELGAKLLDNVFKVLNTDKMGGNITKSFVPPMADETMSAEVKKGHIANVAKIISNIDSDFASLNKFLNNLKKGKALNVSELQKPMTTFNALCNGDPVAINVLNALMTYGVGSKRKGPGEFALAMMSPFIKLADGQGDIEIQGVGKVELKSETTAGGGRLGMGGPSRESQLAVLEKYRDQAPEFVAYFDKNKSITINPFMKLMNQTLPLPNAKNKKLRSLIANEILALTFDKFAKQMAKGFAQADLRTAQLNFIKYNFEWYKAKDNFDAFMIMNFPQQKIMIAKSGDELINLFTSGQLQGGGAGIIHTGQPSEVYTQMRTSKMKV